VKSVPCPRCGAPAVFGKENTWRPFCSERCKTIDLGDWASERFRVPTQEGPEEESKDPKPEEREGR